MRLSLSCLLASVLAAATAATAATAGAHGSELRAAVDEALAAATFPTACTTAGGCVVAAIVDVPRSSLKGQCLLSQTATLARVFLRTTPFVASGVYYIQRQDNSVLYLGGGAVTWTNEANKVSFFSVVTPASTPTQFGVKCVQNCGPLQNMYLKPGAYQMGPQVCTTLASAAISLWSLHEDL